MALQTQTFAHDPKMNDCIEACNATREAALRTLAWVTSDGFENTTPEFVRLLCDCAEITQTAANFMLRGSELHHETCKACEEVCEAVLEACQEAGLDETADFQEQLRTCVENCREMAHAGGRGASEGDFSVASKRRSSEPTKGTSNPKARTGGSRVKGGR
jgi:hypothetical protein